MTYQEKYEQLKNRVTIASDQYIAADKEMETVNGFFDRSLLDNLTNAKNKFEIASNDYHNFLLLVEKNNSDPNDIYSNS